MWPGRSTGSSASSAVRISRDVDLDVREARGAESEHDVARVRGVLDALRQLQRVPRAHAVEQLLGVPLLERHHAGAHALDARVSRSTPIVATPRSAKLSASGSPTRPRPTTETSYGRRRSSPGRRVKRSRRADSIAHAALPQRTGARRPPRTPGCSAGSATQQPPRLLRQAEEPLEAAAAASRRGAWLLRPARKSNAAPTPTSTGASSSGRMRAIHFSCLGAPMPTHTTSGAVGVDARGDLLLLRGGQGRWGGDQRPTIVDARVAASSAAASCSSASGVCRRTARRGGRARPRGRSSGRSARARTRGRGESSPSRLSAHTSGLPSGTLSDLRRAER